MDISGQLTDIKNEMKIMKEKINCSESKQCPKSKTDQIVQPITAVQGKSSYKQSNDTEKLNCQGSSIIQITIYINLYRNLI